MRNDGLPETDYSCSLFPVSMYGRAPHRRPYSFAPDYSCSLFPVAFFYIRAGAASAPLQLRARLFLFPVPCSLFLCTGGRRIGAPAEEAA